MSGTLSDGQGTGIGDFDNTDSISDTNVTDALDYYGFVDLLGTGPDFVVLQFAPTEIFVYGNPPDPSNVTPPTVLADAQIEATAFTTCFAAGTLIKTPEDECSVEDLSIGDLVITAEGNPVAVKWIGRQTVHKIFTPMERFLPVRVSAGALDRGVPHTDLVLTADHALIIDGLAVNAGALVNDTSIVFERYDDLPNKVTYYHVETDSHEVILANGAPAETYVDYVARRAFDNHEEYVQLYGDDRTIREMSLPRISARRLVPPSIVARLASSKAA